MTTEQTDIRMMRQALSEASIAASENEVPIGAIITAPDGTIIGRGHNLTERLGDVTAHAEMQAITAAAETLGGKYLTGCTIYVTVEPCLMCAGAIGWSQISRIVFGASDPKRGYHVYTDASPFHPKAKVTSGILDEECSAMIKNFFADRRR